MVMQHVCSLHLANPYAITGTRPSWLPYKVQAMVHYFFVFRGKPSANYVGTILSSRISTWENNDPRNYICTKASTGMKC